MPVRSEVNVPVGSVWVVVKVHGEQAVWLEIGLMWSMNMMREKDRIAFLWVRGIGDGATNLHGDVWWRWGVVVYVSVASCNGEAPPPT